MIFGMFYNTAGTQYVTTGHHGYAAECQLARCWWMLLKCNTSVDKNCLVICWYWNSKVECWCNYLNHQKKHNCPNAEQMQHFHERKENNLFTSDTIITGLVVGRAIFGPFPTDSTIQKESANIANSPKLECLSHTLLWFAHCVKTRNQSNENPFRWNYLSI